MELEKPNEHQNDVVAKLAKHVIATAAAGSNLVFSPTSINVLLSLIAAGSSGISKEQIISFLGSPSSDHLNEVLAKTVYVLSNGRRSNLRLSAAYGVWINKSLSLKTSFKELLEKSYKASCNQVDFCNKPGEVIDEVNKWAEIHTNGFINHILSHDSINTVRESKLILTNATYFKAAWLEQFDPKLTNDNDFCLLDGTSVKVPFMKSLKDQCIEEYDGFKVLVLPYVKDHRQFSMYMYLPDDRDGLPALLEKIGSESGFLDNYIPKYLQQVGEFRIPKFKFSFEFQASNVLKDMGLTSPFNEGSLTEMVDFGGEKLYVSNILHKACIEVDEKGTEAAAVSISFTKELCARPRYDFVADHPFLFTVREDKSGVILFIGQVLDPSKH